MFDDISRWQNRVADWHERYFGPPTMLRLGLKVAEEAGEVCEAILKVDEGHPRAAEMDLGHELADLLVTIMVAADAGGYSLHDELVRRTLKLPGWVK